MRRSSGREAWGGIRSGEIPDSRSTVQQSRFTLGIEVGKMKSEEARQADRARRREVRKVKKCLCVIGKHKIDLSTDVVHKIRTINTHPSKVIGQP